MMLDTARVLELVKILRGRVCRCGKAKAPRTAFCGECYHALPANLATGLWKRIGRGFEAAYAAAEEWLRANG